MSLFYSDTENNQSTDECFETIFGVVVYVHTGVFPPSAEKSGHDQFEESTEEVCIRSFVSLRSTARNRVQVYEQRL